MDNILRVGTDCSGIEAPIQALIQLGIPHKHIWSSDIDKYVIKSIKANYEPEIIFGDPKGPYPDGDITKRDVNILPDIDLYVAGFPCQPFSTAGRQKGFEDRRGNVFWSCLEVIKVKQPKYFILENVKGLLWNDKENKKDKYGRTWNTIWSALDSLKEYGYTLKWKLMNTRDYGIPQNRERIYMVGIKNDDFEWPKKVEMDDLRNYVDEEDNSIFLSNKKNINKISKDVIFIDKHFCRQNDTYPNASKWCPCINTQNGLWCVIKNRYANVKERLNLQGFFGIFIQDVSDTQLNKQIGNSMSVNVVKAILNSIFKQ
jgi:DNA (cytosine-5)-methyltransferase 1